MTDADKRGWVEIRVHHPLVVELIFDSVAWPNPLDGFAEFVAARCLRIDALYMTRQQIERSKGEAGHATTQD